ncbi:hypothetical protein CALCODRAFT_411033, partial [Calocera cornea HHB12733]
NNNTIKDVTPMPDQDEIRRWVARFPFRSKLDLRNAFEMLRVEPDDVWKTSFQ